VAGRPVTRAALFAKRVNHDVGFMGLMVFLSIDQLVRSIAAEARARDVTSP
jgi:hypothetical protein